MVRKILEEAHLNIVVKSVQISYDEQVFLGDVMRNQNAHILNNGLNIHGY